jgi:hypothetical protein
MEQSASIIFEGVCEHQPLGSDDRLVYSSLSLNYPLRFARIRLSAAPLLMRDRITTLGFDWITAGELGKDPGCSH